MVNLDEASYLRTLRAEQEVVGNNLHIHVSVEIPMILMQSGTELQLAATVERIGEEIRGLVAQARRA